MKTEYDIYKERLQINNERKKINEQIKKLQNDIDSLRNQCSHGLVLAFDDHEPHKIGRIYHCCCPACGKMEHRYNKLRFENTSFQNSKIIDLTNIPMINFKNYFNQIINYIFENYDYFYNNCSEKEIEKSIFDIVKLEENPKILKK